MFIYRCILFIHNLSIYWSNGRSAHPSVCWMLWSRYLTTTCQISMAFIDIQSPQRFLMSLVPLWSLVDRYHCIKYFPYFQTWWNSLNNLRIIVEIEPCNVLVPSYRSSSTTIKTNLSTCTQIYYNLTDRLPWNALSIFMMLHERTPLAFHHWPKCKLCMQDI